MKKKDKSVCFITQTGCYGGLELHTLTLIKHLIQNNYKVELVSCQHRRYEESLKSAGLQEVRQINTDLSVNITRKSPLSRWRPLLNMLESDILVFPNGWHCMGSLSFLKICRKAFKKVIYIEHNEVDPMPPKKTGRYLGGLIKGLGLWWYKIKYFRKVRSQYADQIIAVSEKATQSLIHNYFWPAEKIITVSNGIEWQGFSRNVESNDKIRNYYSIPEKAFVFGILARMDPMKGIDLALKAFSLLLKNHEQLICYLIIAGEGNEEQNLKSLVLELGIGDKVFFSGFAAKPQELISAFDSMLFPSRNREGLPLALLEGMASGCIPIVSSVGGMTEVVNSSEIGWVIAPEDIKGLCGAMLDVASQERSIITIKRENAVNRVRDQFDAEKSYKKIVDLIDAL